MSNSKVITLVSSKLVSNGQLVAGDTSRYSSMFSASMVTSNSSYKDRLADVALFTKHNLVTNEGISELKLID